MICSSLEVSRTVQNPPVSEFESPKLKMPLKQHFASFAEAAISITTAKYIYIYYQFLP